VDSRNLCRIGFREIETCSGVDINNIIYLYYTALCDVNTRMTRNIARILFIFL
jgi:hypothetical protein